MGEGLAEDGGQSAEVVLELTELLVLLKRFGRGCLGLTRTITQFPAAMAALSGATTEYSSVCVQGSMYAIPAGTLFAGASFPDAIKYSSASAFVGCNVS